jgi:hypothetical protein
MSHINSGCRHPKDSVAKDPEVVPKLGVEELDN